MQLRSGVVFINGARLDEPYMNKCGLLPRPAAGNFALDGSSRPTSYFVMGDNRCDSTDSRVFGSIRDRRSSGAPG